MDPEIRQRIEALQEKASRAMRRANEASAAVPAADDGLDAAMPTATIPPADWLQMKGNLLALDFRATLAAIEVQNEAMREAIDAMLEANRISIEYWENRPND